MDNFNFSLAQIESLCMFDPDVAGMIQRKLSANKDIFLKQLYQDIDDAIHDIEIKKHMYQDSQWGEDELTSVIITFLKGRLYDAEHDTQHGGHVDILVKHQLGKFEWLGEAKLWDGPKYIHGGWIQLTERYGTGTLRDNHGGMLIFVKQDKSLEKFQSWEKYLLEQVPETKIEKDKLTPLRFMSSNEHPATCLTYQVRHMAVSLYHFTGKN